jgi:hypothetical protein
MSPLLRRVLLLFVVMGSLAVVSAQENKYVSPFSAPYLKAGGSFQKSLGYEPGVVVGGGVNHRFKRWLVLSEAVFDTSKKIDAQSGHSFRAGGGLYLMKGPYGFGGGLRCGRLSTSVYDKSSCRPSLGGAYDGPQVKMHADYFLPGTDKINRLQGVRTMTLIPFTKHIAFEFEFGVYRFNASFGTAKHTAITANPGMRYVF